MKIGELSNLLKSEGYDPRWYSFDRSTPPLEGFILENIKGRWSVSYFERGGVREIANFELESDACEYTYSKMESSFGSVLNKIKH